MRDLAIARIKQGTKELLNQGFRLKPKTNLCRIIYYHSVDPERPRSHRPEDFQRQLQWLKSEGFDVIALNEVPERLAEKDSAPWVALTFDDGYQDNLKYALPILLEEDCRATFFIVAGMVRAKPLSSDEGHRLYEDRPMLSESDVRELHEAGMEIASHRFEHHQAQRTLLNQGPDALKEDLMTSKARLEDIIGADVMSFSYPNGQKGAFSAETRALVKEAGYKLAATTIWGSVADDADLLNLPRCEMSNNDSFEEFQAKIWGRRDYRTLWNRTVDRSGAWYEGARQTGVK